MLSPFSDIAKALHDIADSERSRIAFCAFHVARGRSELGSDVELGGWRNRLALIEEAATVFSALSPHETTVRALDPRLQPRPAAAAPTMFR